MSDVQQTRKDLDVLKQAQILDKQIYDISQELLIVPREIESHEMRFQEVKKVVGDGEASVKTAKLRQKEKELEHSQKEEQILKLQGQLMQVKTNKEYSAIQHEIASMQADKSLLEEVILKLMYEVEASAKDLNAATSRFQEEEKALAARKDELKEREKVLRAQIVSLKNQKKDLMVQVSQETAGLYEKILAKKNGIALAPVDGENCSACHMKLRPQIQNEIKMKEALVVCENCARILYEED